QGFDAEAVTGEDQSVGTGVPQSDREHPAQSGDAVCAHLLVEMDDGLGITPRPKAMPAGDQVAPQVMVIVDLPIEDDLNGAILVGDRLLPAGDVDDRQPAHAERHLGGDEVAAVVRAAVDDRVAHRAAAIPSRTELGKASVTEHSTETSNRWWRLNVGVRVPGN